MTPPSPTTDVSRWTVWWLGTWLVGVMVGSLVVSTFHAPSRPGDAAGPGAVLDPPIGVLGLSLVGLWSAYLGGMWLAEQRLGDGDVRGRYGISFAPVDLIGIPIGVAAQLGLVRVLYVPLERIWPGTFSDDRLADTARDLVDRADGALIVLLVLLVVVGAPIVEELFYRGFLQRPLLSAAGTDTQRWLVVIGVAAVFAAIHFRPVEFPGLFAFGLVAGICGWKTGRLGMPIVTHVAFNATGIVSVL